MNRLPRRNKSSDAERPWQSPDDVRIPRLAASWAWEIPDPVTKRRRTTSGFWVVDELARRHAIRQLAAKG